MTDTTVDTVTIPGLLRGKGWTDHQKTSRKPKPRFQKRYPRKPTLARIARFEAMRARLMGKD